MLGSLTVCPAWMTASGSPEHVDIESTWCWSAASFATELQIDAPPRLSLVASMRTPWPCRWPSIVTILPGTFTVQSRWVSDSPAGMEYSESPHWSMSSHTGLRGCTGSHEERTVKVTWIYTVCCDGDMFIRSASRFHESYQRTR